MQVWLNLVLAVQLITAIVMVGLILMQQGKGADMGASFGSGASGSLFGATGSANFLSRSTSVCAGLFFVCTLALVYFGGSPISRDSGGSVFDRAPAASAPAASSAPAVGQIPTLSTPAVAASAPAPAASVAVVPKQ